MRHLLHLRVADGFIYEAVGAGEGGGRPGAEQELPPSSYSIPSSSGPCTGGASTNAPFELGKGESNQAPRPCGPPQRVMTLRGEYEQAGHQDASLGQHLGQQLEEARVELTQKAGRDLADGAITAY